MTNASNSVSALVKSLTYNYVYLLLASQRDKKYYLKYKKTLKLRDKKNMIFFITVSIDIIST